MRIRSRRKRYTPIGVEIDGPVARAAQYEIGDEGAMLHAVAEVRLPMAAGAEGAGWDGRACDVLRGVLERRYFQGNRITLAPPVSMIESDLLDLSELRNQQTGESVRTLMARATRTASTEFEVAYWPRAGDANGLSAYAMAVTHSAALQLVMPFEEAGLDVVRLGCPAAALAEVVEALQPPPARRQSDRGGDDHGVAGGGFGGGAKSCVMVVRMGVETNLVLICSGANVLYQRTLDAVGLGRAPGFALASALGRAERHEAIGGTGEGALTAVQRHHLSDIAAEVRETLECVPRTFGSVRVTQVVMSGIGAEMPGVVEHLRQLIPGCVRFEAGGVAVAEGVPTPGAAMDIAMGLALQEVES